MLRRVREGEGGKGEDFVGKETPLDFQKGYFSLFTNCGNSFDVIFCQIEQKIERKITGGVKFHLRLCGG